MSNTRNIAVTIAIGTALVIGGCTLGGPDQTQREQPRPEPEPKTVIVNEGMSEQEERELSERVAELEEQQQDQPVATEPPEPQEEVTLPDDDIEPVEAYDPSEARSDAEAAAADAAVAYYEAAAAGDYEYTYSQLGSIDRSIFSLGGWIAANQQMGSDQATYEVTDATLSNPQTAEVVVLVNGETRYTRFIYESGSWKHELSMQEFNMFQNAQSSASASASASSF